MLLLKLTHSLFFYSLCGNRIQLFQPTCPREGRSHFQRVHHLGPNHESGQLRQGQAERSRDTWMLLCTPQAQCRFPGFLMSLPLTFPHLCWFKSCPPSKGWAALIFSKWVHHSSSRFLQLLSWHWEGMDGWRWTDRSLLLTCFLIWESSELGQH